MIRLAITFTARRFHATPWGHHHNEAVPEWPPAPWRLLRAFASVAYTTMVGAERDAALAMLGRLAMPPSFALPPASHGQSTTYAPVAGVLVKRHKPPMTTILHDGFVVPGGPVYVSWDVDMPADERAMLVRLCAGLAYIGRAESWADVVVLEDGAFMPEVNSAPSDGAASRTLDVVRVLCPASGFTTDQLGMSVEQIKEAGWLDPPGSRWALYSRPRFATGKMPQMAPKRAPALPVVAELALGGRRMLRAHDMVRVADMVRQACMSIFGKRYEPRLVSTTLSGRENGRPLRRAGAQHQHAHYIPEARGGRGVITHVLIYAPAGFTTEEQDAISRVTYLGGEDSPIRCSCSGFGSVDDFREASPLFATSKTWNTRTPLMMRGRGLDIEARVQQELAWRGFTPATSVDVTPYTGPMTGVREKDAHVEHGQCYDVTLRWDALVSGPVLIGMNGHYGMGQLVPVA